MGTTGHGLTSIQVPTVTVKTARADCFYSSAELNGWAGSFGVEDQLHHD